MTNQFSCLLLTCLLTISNVAVGEINSVVNAAKAGDTRYG